jgi:hypothetical protein
MPPAIGNRRLEGSDPDPKAAEKERMAPAKRVELVDTARTAIATGILDFTNKAPQPFEGKRPGP